MRPIQSYCIVEDKLKNRPSVTSKSQFSRSEQRTYELRSSSNRQSTRRAKGVITTPRLNLMLPFEEGNEWYTLQDPTTSIPEPFGRTLWRSGLRLHKDASYEFNQHDRYRQSYHFESGTRGPGCRSSHEQGAYAVITMKLQARHVTAKNITRLARASAESVR